ncbi:hypothetical protein [Lapidilactobacillus wuchangensis]|uniref:hypothetical protein n=1 Tax=Lapidilactobacillus wuchangensis TaxID=2486001 RepID=UPI0013DE2F79|nr:hypothetical protein [Lapidilactobacillus wuchangensis]
MESDAILFLPTSSGFNDFELWPVISINQSSQRSTTSKPGMASKRVLLPSVENS